MPEFNRNFAQGKMNKDLDERLVPKGQYVDAMNIEVSTSEGSNVGALENLLGNINVTPDSDAKGGYVVGSITNGEENCIYYLVAGKVNSMGNAQEELYNKDYIIKYDIDSEQLTYVFVDIYQATKEIVNIQPGLIGNDGNEIGSVVTLSNNEGVKPGMKVALPGSTNGLVTSLTNTNTGVVTNDQVVIAPFADVSGLNVGDYAYFFAPRILNYSKSRLITGINIVDDFIMWTDDHTEPKKVNIKRSYLGTGANTFAMVGLANNAKYSTRVVSRRDDGSFIGGGDQAGLEVKRADYIFPTVPVGQVLNEEPQYVEEDYITVKKRDPLTPPTLRMSITDRCSFELTTNTVEQSQVQVAAQPTQEINIRCQSLEGDCTLKTACRNILTPEEALAAPFNIPQNIVDAMWPDGTPASYQLQNPVVPNPITGGTAVVLPKPPFQVWYEDNFGANYVPRINQVASAIGTEFLNGGYSELPGRGPIYWVFPDGTIAFNGGIEPGSTAYLSLSYQLLGTLTPNQCPPDHDSNNPYPQAVLNPDSPDYDPNYITNIVWQNESGFATVYQGTGILGQTETVDEASVETGSNAVAQNLPPEEAVVIDSDTQFFDECTDNPITTSLTNYDGFTTDIGVIETGTNLGLVFDSAVDYRVGDILLLTNDLDQSETSFNDFQVRLEVTGVPAGADNNNIFNGIFNVIVLSIDVNLASGDDSNDFYVRLEQEPSLFEFTFPRFAYRYKYNDGEYSAFSPFSEIAFLPGSYDYEPKRGWNLAMANQLRSLSVENYAPLNWNRCKDIAEIDILFKEEKSTSVYTVKTIKPSDGTPLWPTDIQYHETNLRGSFRVASEMIHALVPSNQLIRPWDNVPRKALAQEVTGNRLVYGNYLQNYDLVAGAQELITPEINLSFGTNTHPEDLSAQKSLKSIRTYQIGIIYKDFLGRETPVLADKEKGSVTVDKEFCNDVNFLQARITSPHPTWAKSFKYFIKETSAEYYNLALSKWYNAEDGNVWLSFNSSDRNKVDIETFLELKKAHDSDTAVEERARYKIVAIENEAPEDIRIRKIEQGRVVNNAANTLIGEAGGNGFPFSDRAFIMLEEDAFNENFDEDTIVGGGGYALRIFQGTNRSEFYDISRTEPANGGFYKIHLQEQFGPDVNFCSTNDLWNGRVSGISVAIYKKESKNLPEFDGKFFVKIYKDIILETNVLITDPQNMTVDQSYALPYLMSYELNSSGEPNYGSNSGEPAPNTNPYNPNYTWGDNTFPGSNEAAVRYRDGDDNTGYGGILGGDGPLSRRHIRTARSSNSAVPTGLAFWHFVSNINTGVLETDEFVNKHRVRAFLDEAWANVWWTDFENDENDNSNDGENGVPNYPNYADDGDWENSFVNRGILQGGNAQNIDDPTYISGPGDVIQGSANANNYRWVQGSRGIYDIDGVPMMDISVCNIRPGEGNTKWNSHFEDTNCETVPGIAWSYEDQRSWIFRGYADTEANNASTASVKNFIDRMLIEGTIFRFREDPDQNVFTVKAWREHTGIQNCSLRTNIDSSHGNPGNASIGNKADKLMGTWNKRNKFTVALDQDPRNLFDPREVMSHDMSMDGSVTIEFLAPFGTEDGVETDNPAVFETLPKENIELDIYYEIGRAYPIVLEKNNDETEALLGDTVVGAGVPDLTRLVEYHIFDQTGAGVCNIELSNPVTVNAGDILTINDAWDGKVQVEVSANVINQDIVPINKTVAQNNLTYTLPWFNCYSFGNGVESDRIRDDFNQPTIQNGVKASTTIAEQYREERRGSGLIYSGIYNTRTGVNRLNQFIQGEKITKDLNPDLGTIQKLFQRQTNLVTFCEDKVVKILSDKDALFNADGNANVTATARVLGAVTPFEGEYGISKNPESFASESYRAYFTDQQRGAVCRLSKNGIDPISDIGMKDYFTDIMTDPSIINNSRMLGTFDKRKDEYNITISEKPSKRFPTFEPVTVTYSSAVNGWVSFKSFIPESGVSINNQYYTFNNGDMWKHHANPIRNMFYDITPGNNEYSCVSVLFNDLPSSVKNFQTIKYEGTQARINQFTTVNVGGVDYTDKNYYNLTGKAGWYVEEAYTDLAEGKVPEFINKEGKWFNNIFGECTNLENLDEHEFQVQGIGMATLSGEVVPPADPDPEPPVDPEPHSEDIGGCTCASADNYDPNATIDDGSCTFCANFAVQLINVQHARLGPFGLGSIQATGTGGSNNYSLTIYDENGVPQNPFALPRGRYQVCVEDLGSGCHPGCSQICLPELVEIL